MGMNFFDPFGQNEHVRNKFLKENIQVHAERVYEIRKMVEIERKKKNLSLTDEIELPINEVCERLNIPSLELLDVWLRQVAEFSAFLHCGTMYITSCRF